MKRIPPPLVPLPYHLLPKRLVDDLKLNPPLIAAVNLKGDPNEDKMSRKRTKMLEKLNPMIEVYERNLDV